MAHQLMMALLRKSDFMFVAGQFPCRNRETFRGQSCAGELTGEGALRGIVGRRSRTREGEKLKREAYAVPVPAGPSRPHRLFWS